MQFLLLMLAVCRRNPGAFIRLVIRVKRGRIAESLRLLNIAALFLHTKPYDVVYCHFGSNGLLCARLRELGFVRGRVVTVFHGRDVSAYIRRHGEHAYNSLFRKGDLFMPVSEYWRERLASLGCDGRKTVVHRMGVDCRKISFFPRTIHVDTPVRILTIARFVEKKGIEFGLRAIARILERHPNVEYHIVGDGPLRRRYTRLIDELDIPDRVHLQGWRDQDEVRHILAQSHLFLCPSITAKDGDMEGIPVALMEAMAAGLPVIATFHSAIPELVKDGVYGYLVPERDIDSLVERMSRLLDHPEQWTEMGHAARFQVETRHDIEKLNDRLVTLFEGLL